MWVLEPQNAFRYENLAAKAEADENSREHAANGDLRSKSIRDGG